MTKSQPLARTSASSRPAPRQVVRTDVIDAIAALNKDDGQIGWYNPSIIAERVHAVRNTLSTALKRMANLGMLERRKVENAGVVKGTTGYLYALPGTAPYGEPYDEARAKELTDAALESVRDYLAKHTAKKPAPRVHRGRALGPGRAERTLRFDSETWSRVETLLSSQGVPKHEVLDHVLRFYLDAHAQTATNPHERLNRLPPISRPRATNGTHARATA